MSSSVIYPGEFFINDDNYGQFVDDPILDGDQKTRGRIPRDWEKEPFGSLPFAAGFPDELLIPQSDWIPIIQEKERTQTQLSQIVRSAGLPCKDQDGTN